MWVGLENRLVTYTDDATLLTFFSSPIMRPFVAEPLNRNLAEISV